MNTNLIQFEKMAVFTRLHLFLLVLSILFAQTNIPAKDNQKNVDIKPLPAWVNPLPVNKSATIPTDDVNSGLYYLLVEKQVEVESETDFTHIAYQIISDAGLSTGAEIIIDFDPSYQQLNLHHIRILRNDKIINHLDLENARIIQREENLERKLYDARLSCIFFLEDVRVNDIVEFAYSKVGRNPIFQGKYMGSFSLQWSLPVHQVHCRLISPKNRKMYFKCHHTDERHETEAQQHHNIYTWKLTDVPALINDGDIPSWYYPYAWVQVSEFATWQEIVDWAKTHYQITQNIDADLRQKIKEIRREFPDLESRVLAALHYVQDEVRYLGIEIGPNSYKPSKPGIVFNRRFGDCKDKTLLFCTMLKELGLEAYPAFVNTAYRHKISDFQPSAYAFNHVVAKIQLNQRDYWVDPTIPYQRGKLENIYIPNYRSGLLIKDGVSKLSAIPEGTTALPKIKTFSQYEIFGYDLPVYLMIRTMYYGYKADEMRGFLARTSKKEYEKTLLNYVSQLYPGAQADSLTIFDNETENMITVTEYYLIDDFWTISDDSLTIAVPVQPVIIPDYIYIPASIVRTMPIGIYHPTTIIENISVVLPDENWDIADETKEIENDAIRFHFQSSYDNNEMSLRYEYSTLSDVVDAKNTTRYIKDIKEINDYLQYEFTQNSQWGSEPQTLNWMLLMLTTIFIGMSVFGVAKLYQYQPIIDVETVDDPPDYRELEGLSGWLILVGIVLVVRFFSYLIASNDYIYFYDLASWNALTSSNSEAYDPLWMPVLIFEIFVHIAMWVYTVLLLILFYKKKASFPPLIIAYFIINFITMAIDYVLADNITAVKEALAQDYWSDLFRAFVALIIWIPYFKKSKRVKAIFIH